MEFLFSWSRQIPLTDAMKAKARISITGEFSQNWTEKRATTTTTKKSNNKKKHLIMTLCDSSVCVCVSFTSAAYWSEATVFFKASSITGFYGTLPGFAGSWLGVWRFFLHVGTGSRGSLLFWENVVLNKQ